MIRRGPAPQDQSKPAADAVPARQRGRVRTRPPGLPVQTTKFLRRQERERVTPSVAHSLITRTGCSRTTRCWVASKWTTLLPGTAATDRPNSFGTARSTRSPASRWRIASDAESGHQRFEAWHRSVAAFSWLYAIPSDPLGTGHHIQAVDTEGRWRRQHLVRHVGAAGYYSVAAERPNAASTRPNSAHTKIGAKGALRRRVCAGPCDTTRCGRRWRTTWRPGRSQIVLGPVGARLPSTECTGTWLWMLGRAKPRCCTR